MIKIKCSCEMKKHIAPIDTIKVGSNILSEIPLVLKKYKRIYLVCDENTYKACGEQVEKILKNSNQLSHTLILPDKSVPDYTTIGHIIVHANDPASESNVFKYSPLPDFILGVGSGVINDTCRVASYRLNLPYGICGTAPSMDGYASAGSPTIVDGIKRTIKCTTPKVIIADTSIMKDAPYDMLLSGIGDMFGKYTAMFDWELAHEKNGEYFCPEIAKSVIDATDKCLNNGYNLKSRDENTIHHIIDGLLVSGVGMAYTNTSRPASGAEHIIAHVWETEDIAKGKMPDLHGIDVCEGTLLQIIMIKKLLSETDDEFIKNLALKYMPYFDKVEKFCADTLYPIPVKEKEKIKHAILRALTLRNRYTIIFYLNSIGKLDEYAEYASTEFVKKYVK
ncbi:MAG: sn-glycerol-1-phosphate dehydrogenase [Clostridia bacterium]|nr:sn-glycerol-1-phosphate dehydrogenase [Clostridia bacterium]